MADSTTQAGAKRTRPKRLVLRQPMMDRMLFALAPICVMATYRFGWRAVAMIAVSVVTGLVVEGLFTLRRGEPISRAVLVTAVIFALICPVTVPLTMVAAGMAFATVFGKMVFGGWSRNIFNPAMVGRCFLYVCFPPVMTGAVFGMPASGFPGGFGQWAPAPDAITQATPIFTNTYPTTADMWLKYLLGEKAGSMGETGSLLIILCGLSLMLTRTARWRGTVATLTALVAANAFLGAVGAPGVANPFTADSLGTLMTRLFGVLFVGGYLFGAFFMITDPVSAPRTKTGRVIFGAGVGIMATVIRTFGIWVAGFMFSLLLMNAFAPITDIAVNAVAARRKARDRSG